MKKLVSVVAAVAMVGMALPVFAAKKAKTQGKVLNICVWNEEFQSRFRDYFEKAGKLPADVKVNWIITPNQGSAYQNKLDELLLNQENVSADEKIDLFLVEADYAQRHRP